MTTPQYIADLVAWAAIGADAVKSASHPHHFMAVTKGGRSAIAATSGNEDCHIILRGGSRPNYDSASVASAAAELTRAGVVPRMMVDASHANSSKNHENQPLVIADIARQLSDGERRIVGVMIESNLVAGRQDVLAGTPLTYGQSITDGCIDWNTPVPALNLLADAVAARRDVQRRKFRERSA
jgi:3-deoxy-7-phosphoheptulonate synthase